MERSHNSKQNKYALLVADLSRHYGVWYHPLDVSMRVRVQFNKGKKSRIKSVILECCTPLRRDGKMTFGGEQRRDQDICL